MPLAPSLEQVLAAERTIKLATVAVQTLIDQRGLTKWLLPVVSSSVDDVRVTLYAFGALIGSPPFEERVRIIGQYDEQTIVSALDRARQALVERGEIK